MRYWISMKNLCHKKCMFFAFLVSLLPRMVIALLIAPVRTVSDEIVTMAAGATLAGLDWTAVVGNYGYFYGGGFSMLMAPFFAITDNPYVIYGCYLLTLSLMQALIAVFAYKILHEFMGVEEKKFLFLASVACSYFVVTRATLVYNDNVLVFLSWMLAYFLGRLFLDQDNKRKKRLWTLLTVAVLAYSRMVHTRAITYWIAFLILIVLYGIFYRKLLVSKLVIPLLAAGFVLSDSFNSWLKSTLWASQNGSTLINSEIQVATSKSLSDPWVFKTWLKIYAGQIQTILIFSGGMVLICLLLYAVFYISYLGKNRGKERENWETIVFLFGIFFIGCVAITIVGQSFIWLDGAVDAMNKGYGTTEYGLKVFGYVRYFGPYLGPAFLGGLRLLYEKRDKMKGYVLAGFGTGAVLLLFWMKFIFPYICNNINCAEVFFAFSLWKRGTEITKAVYLPGVICYLILFGVLGILLIRKKPNHAITILVLSLMFQYCWTSYGHDMAYSRYNADFADKGYEYVKELEKNGEEVPEKIYVIDTSRKTKHQNFFMYQFFLNRYKIIPEYPPEDNEDCLVFSNLENDEKLLDQGYTCRKLDWNEFFYEKENTD